MKQLLLLGVNIDHIATIRQARGTRYPDPIQAALLAEDAGADSITVHLREDRRHIQDRDIYLLRDTLQTHMNLEMAVTQEMIAFAAEIRPQNCCLVPEKRHELTTEGGLDVIQHFSAVKQACEQLAKQDIEVSLFIDPERQQIDAAKQCGAPTIEIHTGCYAEAITLLQHEKELTRIIEAVSYAHQLGLTVNAGHGLHYHNVQAIASIPHLNELNIGHAIIARAFMVGIAEAVREMKRLMLEAR